MELFGCCPLPSRESALSYSLVRGAPLQAVFRGSLGALSFSTRAPHFQHHLICPVAKSRCFLLSGMQGWACASRRRTIACLSSLLPALAKWTPR